MIKLNGLNLSGKSLKNFEGKDEKMNANVKKISAFLMIFFVLSLTACSSYGVKKEEENYQKTHIAYYYTRRGESGVEYCLSMLKAEEELDMVAEPNVYISDKEFDFEWGTDLLAVFLDEDAEPKEPTEIDGYLIAYGYLA